jgi:hypothetical protein
MGYPERVQTPVNIGDDSLPMPSNLGQAGRCQSGKPNKIAVPYRFLRRADLRESS